MSLFPKVHQSLVVGAGYAGLPLALRLAREIRSRGLESRAQVTLVNPENRQELTCDLYRTLRTGKPEILGFLDQARDLGIRFIEGSVVEIDPARKQVQVRGELKQSLNYDTIALAPGSRPRIPKLEGITELLEAGDRDQKRIFSFRNNAQVLALRLALRRMGWGSKSVDAAGIDGDRFVVVLGAGSTGLEVAGEIAALRGKNSKFRVVLVDEIPELLSDFSPIARRILKTTLQSRRIETVLGSKAVAITDREIHIANGQVIPWDLLVTCVGAEPNPMCLQAFPNASLNGPSSGTSNGMSTRGLQTNAFLQIEGSKDHYALGDLAMIPRPAQHLGNQVYLEKRAQFSVQQGKYLGHWLGARIENPKVSWDEFEVSDLGSMVSLGPGSGVGRLGQSASTTMGKFFSPFIYGPIVEELKNAARWRYKLELKF